MDKQVGGAWPGLVLSPSQPAQSPPSRASLICLLAICLSILRSHSSQPLAWLQCQEFGGKRG